MKLPDCSNMPIHRARSLARVASSCREIRRPAIITCPPSGSSNPARDASRVDFPLPDGPATATSSPACTETDTPRSERLAIAGVEETVELAPVDQGPGLGSYLHRKLGGAQGSLNATAPEERLEIERGA